MTWERLLQKKDQLDQVRSSLPKEALESFDKNLKFVSPAQASSRLHRMACSGRSKTFLRICHTGQTLIP